MIVAFALPLILGLLRVQDKVEGSVDTRVDQSRNQRSRVQAEDYSLNASTSDRLRETVPATEAASRLARLTVYWPEEGDHYTGRRMSSTGVYLSDGHCAVDPKVIPYGSVVKVPGMGEYVAVDTGPAVISRRAARTAGQTSHERNALVVDIFCSSRSKAQEFQENAPEFAVITWYR